LFALDLRPALVGLAVRHNLVSRYGAQVSTGPTRIDEQSMDTRQSPETPSDGLSGPRLYRTGKD
jgi:hypothetical protein